MSAEFDPFERRQVPVGKLSWRDRIQLLNSVLFCVVGAGLLIRCVFGPGPLVLAILGSVFLAFGMYRLALVRREFEKRAGSGK